MQIMREIGLLPLRAAATVNSLPSGNTLATSTAWLPPTLCPVTVACVL